MAETALRYTLGLDLGIASVGWCVLDEDRQRIEDLGVRTFTKAENPKDGSSLAEPRRQARGLRRRLRRKTQRLEDLRRLLAKDGVLSLSDLETLFRETPAKDPYQLRAEGLDRPLSFPEWVRVLYHIAKHRGFQSNHRNPVEDGQERSRQEEEGKLLSGVGENERLLREGGYRTAGEMLARDPKFQDHRRNRAGDYSHTLSRSLLLEEARRLFQSQRTLGNPHASSNLEEAFLHLVAFQNPFASGEDIRNKAGHCSLEPDQIRAPRRSASAETFMLLQKTGNLRLIHRRTGEERPLTDKEREQIHLLAWKQEKVTHKTLRRHLEIPEEWLFTGLPYHRSGDKAEEKLFVHLAGIHGIRKALDKGPDPAVWDTLRSRRDLLDSIADTLTFYKNEDEILPRLESLSLSPENARALAPLSFSGTSHLSLSALGKLLPHLEGGKSYTQARADAGYAAPPPDRHPKLPPLEEADWRNPVVFRALTQTRKVVNALVRRYGPPWCIHLETARELSQPAKVRRRIETEQQANEKKKQQAEREFLDIVGTAPGPGDLLKMRLWREQGGFCPYCEEYLDPTRLAEPGYAEMDHILPYSRSLDNGWHNRVLVHGKDNRDKGNRTPFEAFGGDAARWDRLVAWVQASHLSAPKKRNLLREDFGEEAERELKDRNLTDTRFITKTAATLLRDRLTFHPEAPKDPVMTLNGRLTAFLRKQWGLHKNRKNGDLHHALDAAVLAVASRSFVYRLSSHNAAWGELPRGREAENGFSLPYPAFRSEVLARLCPTREEMLLRLDQGGVGYDEAFRNDLRPVFVSRAPSRRLRGKAHMETLRSPKWKDHPEGPRTASRIPLKDLNLEKLERMVGKDRDRKLYEALRERLAAFGGNGKKAFVAPFRKPCRSGEGPLVRSLRIFDSGYSGVELRDGGEVYAVADHESMVRVDVYAKKNRFYLVPVYVADVARGIVKNRAIVAHKSEEEWDLVDGSFDFRFSLFPGDLVEIEKKDGAYLGYYKSCHRGDGRLLLDRHDRMPREGDCGTFYVSTRKDVLSMSKYQVDPLGEIRLVGSEKPPFVL